MKITFTQNTEPCLYTGWSSYPAGAKADLRYGCELVAIGAAYEGWQRPETPVPVTVEPETVPEPEPGVVLPDYSASSVPSIRKAAKEAGVWNRGMKKNEMIEALEKANE